MKNFMVILGVIALVFSVSGVAGALSGTHIGTRDLDNYKPDSETAALQAILDAANITDDISFYKKIEFEGDIKSGTQIYDSPIAYYGVKAGDAISFFMLEPLTSIDWSTEFVNNKGISHLSAWTVGPGDPPPPPPPPSDPVPEPGTLVLLGLGIVGLGVMGRKARK